ncbi:MAG TPA: DUF4390 domain-containing protein [Piscinibacter sp.]|jgi:hypothetical protein|uniref:DUF4390 domain-containing protein n=1 Tax=Piscinibacter sp. TaxID=1903157 RepID=UPI001D9CB067|nr:DUF4390 domain-containing protein [Pseudomonadota bacterium]HNJ83557.1 DUF4390 domain-containing protein [Piscinibacter sp.]HNK18442.1 DUF4390 domain-containing protein [Piscinibacter sp.]
MRRWLALALLVATSLLHAAGAELAAFAVQRGEDGVSIDYALNFELPRGAEEALAKSVPLYFVAEAEVFRDRWYWRDKRIASASRVWRIVYQPLTSNYRVTFAGLSQSYATRAEAFAAIRRGVSWKIADAGQIEEGSRHYVEFSFRLDTSLLPRPMQIGIASQSDWALSVERMQRFD